jgi:16S rRNA (uracil1498-N3)-methyltransferase
VAPRFHAPGAYASGALVALPEEEAQHLARVLRLRPGDPVRVFNGTGSEFEASVDQVSRTGVHVRIGAPAAPSPEPRVAVTLVQAVLKGDKMDDVVRDAVMLGVAVIQPVVSRRSEVTLASLHSGRRRERWMRVAVSSTKQCGRAVIPPILEIERFEALPDALISLRIPSPAIVLVEPAAAAGVTGIRDLDTAPPREASIVIGPEGGWDPAELEQVSRVCHFVTLGGRTLRADAMPLVALSALFTHWKEF